MNKGEIKTLAQQYAHRTDIEDRLNTWVEWTTARIGDVLRDASNHARITFTPTDRYTALPADFAAMDVLTYDGDGGGEFKIYAGNDATLAAGGAEGTPYFYQISGGNIAVYPTTGRDLNMSYFQYPADMPTDASENAVAARWPMLYVYGLLIEINATEQDAELYAGSVNIFEAEVRRINTAYANRAETMALQVA